MQTAYEIVAQPLKVLVAPVGTKPPRLTANPGPEWKVLGSCSDEGVTCEHSAVPAALPPLATRWLVSEQMQLTMTLEGVPQHLPSGATALVVRGTSCHDASYACQYEVDRALPARQSPIFSRGRSPRLELTFVVDLGVSSGMFRATGDLRVKTPVAVRAAAAQWLTSYLLRNGLTPRDRIDADADHVGMPADVLLRAAKDLHVIRRSMFLPVLKLASYMPESESTKPVPYEDQQVEAWALPGELKELLNANDEYWTKEINKP